MGCECGSRELDPGQSRPEHVQEQEQEADPGSTPHFANDTPNTFQTLANRYAPIAGARYTGDDYAIAATEALGWSEPSRAPVVTVLDSLKQLQWMGGCYHKLKEYAMQRRFGRTCEKIVTRQWSMKHMTRGFNKLLKNAKTASKMQANLRLAIGQWLLNSSVATIRSQETKSARKSNSLAVGVHDEATINKVDGILDGYLTSLPVEDSDSDDFEVLSIQEQERRQSVGCEHPLETTVVARSPGPDDPGHLLRGISPMYLLNTFLPEVLAQGLSSTSNVHEVEPQVIRGKGKHVMCPRDGKLGAAYIDCVSNGQTGQASVMLSYTWRYPVGDIVDTLLDYCRNSGRDEETTFFWICCICLNQQ